MKYGVRILEIPRRFKGNDKGKQSEELDDILTRVISRVNSSENSVDILTI